MRPIIVALHSVHFNLFYIDPHLKAIITRRDIVATPRPTYLLMRNAKSILRVVKFARIANISGSKYRRRANQNNPHGRRGYYSI